MVRPWSLAQSLLIYSGLISFGFWLGVNSSYESPASSVQQLTMPPSPIAFTAPALGNGDGGESLPSATEEEEVYHQLWTGGGVRGLSEGDENVAKDAMSGKLREAFIELFHLPMAQFEHRHISRVSAYSVTQFRRLFMSLAAVNNNSDCLVRMDPFKQLQCYLWAEKLRPLGGGGDGAAPTGSALFSGVAADSMCSLALSCSVWKRGRYQRRLTPAYLGSVFNALVHDEKLLNSSQLLLRNVVHGGDNWREYEWLNDRLKVCEAMILESNFTTTDIDARALFQGGDITTRSVKDSRGRLSSLHLATRDNGDQRVELTRKLTSLEAISVLHHKATNQATPQWIVYPATSTQKQCRTTAINMLLFTGDSLGRQSFRRLLDALRRGTPSPSDEVRVPYGSKFVRTNFRHWPSKAVAKWQDAVLVIYPSYDELHMFESLMPHHNVFYGLPFKRPSDTVNTFFENVVAERRRLRCEDNGGIPPASNVVTEEEPLFYIVFLWDAITNRPRTESLAPCLPTLPLSEFPLTTTHDYNALKRAADQGMNLIHDPPVPSFRALGIRIPLHVHNSNMWDRVESPTTSDWLTRMSVHCNMTAPSSPLNGAATSLRLPGDWVVAEHPTSDSTHLYRVTTQLKHTPASLTRLRVSPPEPWPMVVNESYKFQPTNWRLMRLETPFIWLRNATALVQKRHHEQQQQRTENSHKHNVFFSQLRLLDMGKIMLASGNMFQTSDMLHEGCMGNYWLSGAALHNVSMRPYLRRLSRRVSEVALSLMQHRVNFPGYDWKFSFHPEVDCGQLGTLMTVNTLLIDIVNNERRRTEGRAS